MFFLDWKSSFICCSLTFTQLTSINRLTPAKIGCAKWQNYGGAQSFETRDYCGARVDHTDICTTFLLPLILPKALKKGATFNYTVNGVLSAPKGIILLVWKRRRQLDTQYLSFFYSPHNGITAVLSCKWSALHCSVVQESAAVAEAPRVSLTKGWIWQMLENLCFGFYQACFALSLGSGRPPAVCVCERGPHKLLAAELNSAKIVRNRLIEGEGKVFLFFLKRETLSAGWWGGN